MGGTRMVEKDVSRPAVPRHNKRESKCMAKSSNPHTEPSGDL
eukprot:gene5911-4226_t